MSGRGRGRGRGDEGGRGRGGGGGRGRDGGGGGRGGYGGGGGRGRDGGGGGRGGYGGGGGRGPGGPGGPGRGRGRGREGRAPRLPQGYDNVSLPKAMGKMKLGAAAAVGNAPPVQQSELEPQERVKRPGFGSLGRPTKLRANYFSINFAASQAVFYRVDIKPVRRGGQVESDEDTLARALPRAKARCVIDALAKSESWPAGWAFDDQHTLVSATYFIDQAEHTYEVQATLPDRERPSRFNISIKYTSNIALQELADYCSLRTEQLPRTALQSLDIVLRHAAARRPRGLPIGSGVYFDDEQTKVHIRDYGVEVWEGYLQLLKVTQRGLCLNMAQSIAIMNEPVSLLKFLVRVLRLRSEAQLEQELSQDRGRRRAARALAGMRVHAQFKSESGPVPKRVLKAKNISSKTANSYKFDFAPRGKPDAVENISVAEYYFRTYGIRLKFPNMPLLTSGGGKREIAVPIELFSIIPGQRLTKISPDLLAMVGRHSIQYPEDRLARVAFLPQKSGLLEDSTAASWGMTLDHRMMEVDARVLGTEDLMYGNQKKINPGTTGAWNLRDTRHLQGCKLNCWAVVSTLSDPSGAPEFLKDMVQALEKTGVQVAPAAKNPYVVTHQPRAILEQTFAMAAQEASKRCNAPCQLLMVMIDNRDVDSYKMIKYASDRKVGVISQVIVAASAGIGRRNEHKIRGRLQYTANVSLKINQKLGGKNVASANPLPKIGGKHFMLLGADLTHSAPGSTNPSVASVVGSMDGQGAQYAARCMIQPKTREDTLLDMQHAVADLLREYQKRNQKKLPELLVMYRDGVSEGQFVRVGALEVVAIKNACKEVNANYNPPLTFVTVQKRHSTRFFPIKDNDADGNGNLLPGTVVDRDVCHPWAFDFYLTAHAAIQGTTRPTHYYVLLDENNFSADQLQLLTYRLCYLYCRCTRSVSLVPPAYYAHLAAERGRILGQLDDSSDVDTASVMSGGTAGAAPVQLESMPVPVHAGVGNSMYFV